MERIKRLLVFLWLLFIPTQLGLHFWPEWSHVMGLRVDYLSPILYFLDILWVLMIGLGGYRNPPLQKGGHTGPPVQWIVVAFVLINIFVAQNHWEAVYRWVRIIQWFITFKIILQSRTLFKEMLGKVLPWWIVGEGLLATAQVINGGSINGIFYWLGERRFSYISLGVAQISYFGEGVVRAYGTFSHPNSMAGFILVSLILFVSISPNPLFDKREQSLLKIFKWAVVFCGVLGIILTGSRTVWGITILLIIFNLKFLIFNQFLISNFKKTLGTLLIFGGITTLVLSVININYRISDFVGGWDGEGMSKRGALMVASVKMIKDHPLFGVGASNFLVQLPGYQKNSGVFWLQPVHNIAFLFISEFGIIGLLFLAKFLIFNLKFLINFKFLKKDNFKIIILGIILITGMVDHYWLTLPQNWWLMCIILAV